MSTVIIATFSLAFIRALKGFSQNFRRFILRFDWREFRPGLFIFYLLLAVLVAACSDSSSGTKLQSIGMSYYIDCESTMGGDGTIDAPFDNLEAANSTVLEPGDRLLLRRGSVCNGMLKPQGAGSERNRVVIGAYGDGELPIIDAQGLYDSAVRLNDVSHLVVQDLELTNVGSPTGVHRGVYLTATTRKVENIEIRVLYIHDVTGRVDFCGTAKRGGGIISDSGFQTTDTQIDSVLIENNLIEDVGRSGIYFDGSSAGTGDRPRASEPWPAGGHFIRW